MDTAPKPTSYYHGVPQRLFAKEGGSRPSRGQSSQGVVNVLLVPLDGFVDFIVLLKVAALPGVRDKQHFVSRASRSSTKSLGHSDIANLLRAKLNPSISQVSPQGTEDKMTVTWHCGRGAVSQAEGSRLGRTWMCTCGTVCPAAGPSCNASEAKWLFKSTALTDYC